VPVVVIEASGLVGRRAVPAFAVASPDVRAFVRGKEAVPALREAGAKVAVGALDDVDTLAAVMSGAHTVCHLAGGLDQPDPDAYRPAVVGTLRAALAAARTAGVRRILYLSYPGASPDASNPYLRAKGEAEGLIAASGLEHVVVRTAHVYGPGSRWLAGAARGARARVPTVPGTGRQVVAPVFVDDVAAVLAAADDRDRVRSGTWGLQGPDRVDADGLAELLAGRRRRWVHLAPGTAGRALAAMGGRGPSNPAVLEVLAADSLAEGEGLPDAAAEFGVRLTPLREGLARSGAA
jgi:uncharacterized protein YbjT (DUF2867 family)